MEAVSESHPRPLPDEALTGPSPVLSEQLPNQESQWSPRRRSRSTSKQEQQAARTTATLKDKGPQQHQRKTKEASLKRTTTEEQEETTLSKVIFLLTSPPIPELFGPQQKPALMSQSNYAASESQQPALPAGSPPDPEPLFLTPYIDKCSYYEAREKSKIQYAQEFGVTAYSGYITVNKTARSNLFFLLTEVEGNSSGAPLLLWTQGGPGLSALFGLFLENGPLDFIGFDSSHNPILQPRINTLQKNMSVLYLDLPVGAGFSFTEDEENGYPRTLEDIVVHVKEFLSQFMKVFSEYEYRDFYLAGESYGARYSVAIAYYWNQMMLNESKLNLKGVIGGNGFLGPIFDLADSSDFLYQMSMVDSKGRTEFRERFQLMKKLAASENATLKMYALMLLTSTLFINDASPTLFQNLTLYHDQASPMYTHRPVRMLYCAVFLNQSATKVLLHAGANNTFQIINEVMLQTFAIDSLRDISTFNEHVLNESRVLFYNGQMDALFPSVNQRDYYRRLNWTYAVDYRNTPRYPWQPHQGYYGFAGYKKTVHDFTEVVILGMSHYGAAEKPDEPYFLITEFIANSSKGESVLPTA
ncbi:venom serine carboxypeptidase-like [Dermacentor variabilis]|uniref:venom serine carboxypeptidase-like n=1 Tax=Dermacentor variabilis TaxID=34621 RepID=UPI003F5B7307